MSQSLQIILMLKKTLKAKGIKYADVANHLCVSESSVKRQFTQGDISLNRLEKICDFAGLDIADLLELVQMEGTKLEQLTIQQEKKIISNPKLMLVTVLVLNNLTFEEIYAIYNFEEAELIKILLELEKLRLIELRPENKIKPLISRTFEWQKNGPIQSYFEVHIQDDFFDCKFTSPENCELLSMACCREILWLRFIKKYSNSQRISVILPIKTKICHCNNDSAAHW